MELKHFKQRMRLPGSVQRLVPPMLELWPLRLHLVQVLRLRERPWALAMIYELPLVVVNVQRGGPSTGLPTKTEQSDLLQCMYGRNGESPMIVVAASRPADCFEMAYEASRLALEHMTPVVLLTDGYIANGAEPWRLPDLSKVHNKINVRKPSNDSENWLAYQRDENQVRTWAIPGMEGYEHRLGGLEKASNTGNVSYDPNNHETMCHIREEKVQKAALNIPLQELEGEESGDLLVVSWGGTYGATHMAVKQLQEEGHKVSLMHLKYINPMPKNTEQLLKNFKKVIVAELNLGQMRQILNGKFNVGAKGYNKVQGLPFKISELVEAFKQELGHKEDNKMTENPTYKKKDFVSDQEVRWCPGCGDYAILSAVQLAMTKIGKKKEDIVFVSGIGCSSRFPYYMNTYGLHTIHGRAPAFASGIKSINPDLSVWIITGDGDGLSIGGNHLIHILRRNIDCNIILFNNEIYGLTKGQYSPTSQQGLVTKSTPYGSLDRAFSPAKLAIGAGATFYARTMDTDPKHMQEISLAAEEHKGSALIEATKTALFLTMRFTMLTPTEKLAMIIVSSLNMENQ